jgi:hypothetical protein
LFKETKMLTMPQEIMPLIEAFAPAFSERVWEWAKVLVMGGILAPGKRTVSAVLRVMGRAEEAHYQNYHRVLNRAVWSELKVSEILFGLLVTVLGSETLVVGADDTLERRLGDKVAGKGVFRDPTRSSKQHPVTSPGLRWLSMMLLVNVPWAGRVWGLPFVTVLACSRATHEAQGKRHKTLGTWTRQLITLVRRWCPTRKLVLVVDGGLCALWLGWRCVRLGVTFVSRLRLDTQLYDFLAEIPAGHRGRKPNRGPRQMPLAVRLSHPDTTWERCRVPWYGGVLRDLEVASGTALWRRPRFSPLPVRWVLVRDPLGKLNPAAFFATDLEASPRQILTWVIMRWSIEVTFQELRTHLGFETQRQWSAPAVARTTPALFGLFSLITLLAHRLSQSQPIPARSAAWYVKPVPTFADTIAYVRHYLWTHLNFVPSSVHPRQVLIPVPVLSGLLELLSYST